MIYNITIIGNKLHFQTQLDSSPAFLCIPVSFLCIPVHSCAFLCIPVHSCAFLCIPVHSCAFLCIPVHSCAFLGIPVHSCAFLCIPVSFLSHSFVFLSHSCRFRSHSCGFLRNPEIPEGICGAVRSTGWIAPSSTKSVSFAMVLIMITVHYKLSCL